MFPEVIDNTMHSNFKECPRKFNYAHIRNLQKSSGKGIHLHAGGAFARGLEVTRKAFFVGGASQSAAILAGQEAIVEFWGEPDYEPYMLGNKGLDRLTLGLEYYFDRWPMATDFLTPYLTDSGEHCIEFKFALPLPILHPDTGRPILYAGRCDMIANYHGQLIVEDDKTTGQLGEQWVKNWTLDSQPTGYCWAARTLGHAVTGAIFRGVSFLSLKKDKESGETLLHMSYGGAQAIVTRQTWQIDQWYEQLLRNINRAIVAYKEGYWDLALDKHSCNAYGGCPYIEPCQNRNPEPFLENNYHVVVWNPLD